MGEVAIGHDDNSAVADVDEVVTLGDVVRSLSLTIRDGRSVSGGLWWAWFYIVMFRRGCESDHTSKRKHPCLFLVDHIHIWYIFHTGNFNISPSCGNPMRQNGLIGYPLPSGPVSTRIDKPIGFLARSIIHAVRVLCPLFHRFQCH